MAHPVRPESVIEINNFYTLTVYEKGAEVVRMIHTLLGPEAFRRGTDLYFERHDGQAVTCDDFVRAMEDASGVDLAQFRLWYSQAGTPVLTVRDDYDPATGCYTLDVAQSCPPTPGQPAKAPLLIPLAVGLLGQAGNLPLYLEGTVPDPETTDNTRLVLRVDRARQRFVFEGVGERPVPSLLCDFSAPVRLDYPYGKAELCELMSRDSDGFVRWDSAQALATRTIQEVQAGAGNGASVAVEPLLPRACAALLEDRSLEPAMVALMLTLPGENYLAELASRAGGADVDAIHSARRAVQLAVGRSCAEEFLACYQRLASAAPYAPDAAQVGARSLRNVCLEYLAAAGPEYLELATRQFAAASNMTDRLAALRVIAFFGDEVRREAALAQFYRDWRQEALALNQWFQVQAAIPDARALERVQGLLAHPDFDLRNPNKLRSLVGVFANQNPVSFHCRDGQGYRFLADRVVEMNGINPQMASSLLIPLSKWRNYVGRSELMRSELQRVAALPDLSPDVYEVVTRSLRVD